MANTHNVDNTISNEQKPDEAYVEHAPGMTMASVPQDIAAHQGLVKSRFDDLPILRAVWVFRRAFLYCFLVYTSSLMEGFFITMSGAIIVNQGFINQFGDTAADGTKSLNTSWISAWGAIINFGQIIAALYLPLLADRFGRKWAFYHIFSLFVICLLFLTLAKSPPVWLLGKLFVGIGAGAAQVTSTPYVMEIAPTRIRGGIVTIGLIWNTVGGILVSLMLQICNSNYPLNYKIPIYVVWGPCGLLLLCFLLVPESPWYHARSGNKDAAVKCLRQLYSGIEGYDFEEEYSIILRNLEHEKSLEGEAKAVGWKDVARGANRKRLLIMLALAMSQQFGGLSLIGAYSTYFFSLAGLKDPFLASLIQTCIGLGAVVVYTLIIDKVGRRYPISICFTVMCVVLWVIGGVYYAGPTVVHNVLLALVCIWQPCFTIVGNSYFLIASELPTAQLRIKTGSLSWLLTAIVSIGCTFAVPPLLVHLGIRAAFVFGATAVPFVIIFWMYLPETKGRSVAEIDELYERKVPAWRWRNFETEAERIMRDAVRAEQYDMKGAV